MNILLHFKQVVNLLSSKIGAQRITNVKELMYSCIPDEDITVFILFSIPIYISQFKLFSTQQLAKQILSKRGTKFEFEYIILFTLILSKFFLAL